MTAISLILGAGVGFGLFLVISGWRGAGTGHSVAAQLHVRWAGAQRRAGLALTGALTLGLLSRWPVAVVGGAVLGAFLPSVMGGSAVRQRAIARNDAVAAWAELLRDSLSGAHGLEAVIITTAPIAPSAIRDEVVRLAGRIGHERLTSALRAFADDLGDPTADLVVAALILAAEGSARELGALLGSLAEAARDEAAMRRRVEASRARARSTVQIVTGLTSAMIVGLLLFDRQYLKPYDSPAGQAVLALVASCFGLGLWWLARMSTIPSPERFLAASPDGTSTR
jgi:Flp pilus assembly protein TadB